MFAKRPLVIAVALATLSSWAFAGPSPVGSWKGHVVEMVPTTSTTNPQVARMIAQMKAITVNLKINSDKTFASTPDGGVRKGKTQLGTWSMSGNTITFRPKVNTAQIGQVPTQVMILSSDGKSLIMKLPPGGGYAGKAVFLRG